MSVAKKMQAVSAARNGATSKKSAASPVSGAKSPAAKAAPAKSAPSSSNGIATLSKEAELGAYRQMLLIRRFEEKAGQLYGMGLIGGFCHLYIGQEAVVVGMQMATRSLPDTVITGICWPATWKRAA